MKKKMLPIYLLGVLAFTTSCGGDNTPQAKVADESSAIEQSAEEPRQENEAAKVSETIGNQFGGTLKNPDFGLDIDVDALVKGIRNGFEGKPAPLSEEELGKILQHKQKEAHDKLAKKNLEAAEEFLKENEKKEDVMVLVPGKLQYKIEKKGEGKDAVKEDDAPVIHYKGSLIDGTVFGSSEQSGPVELNLDRTIPGFKQGVVGMTKGETRILYVHPELAYGTSGQLPPNSLLLFEITVESLEGEKNEKKKEADKQAKGNMTTEEQVSALDGASAEVKETSEGTINE